MSCVYVCCVSKINGFSFSLYYTKQHYTQPYDETNPRWRRSSLPPTSTLLLTCRISKTRLIINKTDFKKSRKLSNNTSQHTYKHAIRFFQIVLQIFARFALLSKCPVLFYVPLIFIICLHPTNSRGDQHNV